MPLVRLEPSSTSDAAAEVDEKLSEADKEADLRCDVLGITSSITDVEWSRTRQRGRRRWSGGNEKTIIGVMVVRKVVRALDGNSGFGHERPRAETADANQEDVNRRSLELDADVTWPTSVRKKTDKHALDRFR